MQPLTVQPPNILKSKLDAERNAVPVRLIHLLERYGNQFDKTKKPAAQPKTSSLVG